mmetsp:Transcript_15830/g.14326  ORF Transcript_15830/g.14326 Transcript_15830/m.14326 type:complete len:434 (+) Transcript_15830:60-1361(+)
MASKQYNQPTSGQHVRIGNWFEELKLKEETGYRFQPPQTDKSFSLLTKDRCITHTEHLNPKDYKSTVQSTITPPQAHDQYKWMQTKIGPREKLLDKQRKDTVDKQFEYETMKFNEESRIVDYTSDYKSNFKSSMPLNNKTFEIKKLTTKVGNYITDTPITIYSDAIMNDKSSFHFPATSVGSTNPFGRHSGFSADYVRHTLVSKRGESFEHPYPLPTIKEFKVLQSLRQKILDHVKSNYNLPLGRRTRNIITTLWSSYDESLGRYLTTTNRLDEILQSNYNISLSSNEKEALIYAFGRDNIELEYKPELSITFSLLDLTNLIRRNLSPHRLELVKYAFDKVVLQTKTKSPIKEQYTSLTNLSNNCLSNDINYLIEDIQQIALNHYNSTNKENNDEELPVIFTFGDFIDLYTDISNEIDSEEEFMNLLVKTWNI